MPRISQSVAEHISRKLVEKKRTLQSEALMELRKYCTSIAESKIPKDVMDFFKKNSEYVKKMGTIRLDGKGLNRLDVQLVNAIPSVSPNCYYNHIDLKPEEANKVKSLNDAHEKLKADNSALETEIERTLISLRTYANIEKELPEASEYLPKIGIAVIVDTKSLRKKLA